MMNSVPPPPPPPLPPPPPPPPHLLPPPPPPPLQDSDDGEAATAAASLNIEECRDALATACQVLERARTREAELEALLLFGSSLLKHRDDVVEINLGGDISTHDSTSLDSDVSRHGGIYDAWVALATAVNRTSRRRGSTFMAASGAVDSVDAVESSLSIVEATSIATSTKGDDKVIKFHGSKGRLAVAAHRDCLAGTLHRAAQLASRIENDQMKQGPILKQSVDAARAALAESTGTQQYQPPRLVWLAAFDERLRSIKEYHAKHGRQQPNEAMLMSSKRQRRGNPASDGYDLVDTVQWSLQNLLQEETGEEVLGKYLDLRAALDECASSPPLRNLFVPPKTTTTANEGSTATTPLLYTDFLRSLLRGPHALSEGAKLADRKKYVRFLSTLESYLQSFLARTSPLLRIQQDVIDPAMKIFDDEWSKTGGYEGWIAKIGEAGLVNPSSLSSGADSSNSDSSTNGGSSGIDLSTFESAEQLASQVDGDRLKVELSRLGLKCGGTIKDRASRLFLTKSTPLDQLPAKLFAKKKDPSTTTATSATNGGSAAKGTGENGAGMVTTAASGHDRRIDVARREAVVTALLRQVRPTLEATLRRVERRQTQTLEEQEKELEEELYEADVQADPKKKAHNKGDHDDSDDDDSDDDDEPIYNPKNVPLDWDGKPIPYWLFKLHGLNHYYPCEICGGESYRGRRNFELHFAEPRHGLGMKSLGIPNTKHFHGVTKIEDALALWQTLQEKLAEGQFDTSREEEYEDSHGNVLSRTTYEDLARQGLL